MLVSKHVTCFQLDEQQIIESVENEEELLELSRLHQLSSTPNSRRFLSVYKTTGVFPEMSEQEKQEVTAFAQRRRLLKQKRDKIKQERQMKVPASKMLPHLISFMIVYGAKSVHGSIARAPKLLCNALS